MVHLQVSEHRAINIRRRSLCDNCSIKNCNSFSQGRVIECNQFKPPFVVFMKCRDCGAIYDPYQNIRSLDYELCSECNHAERDPFPIALVCCP
ncbi:MAG TPA: hypothetical protein VMW85_06715 [Methanomassiliicoccales archaeon]|nr:hypothetical protein [Methanomassiliicoccales archaeon]